MSVDTCAPSDLGHKPRRREQRKQQTRRALLDAALELEAAHGFAALSLRQIARRAGVVPTAFYRHFPSMDALGVELVDESVGALRKMVREVRDESIGYQRVITHSIQVLVTHVQAYRAHFGFIARERTSGVAAVRLAIRRQFEMITAELAADLQRFPAFAKWHLDDRRLLAEIIVNQMTYTVETVVETDATRPADAEQIALRAEKQLRMIVMGLRGWPVVELDETERP